MMAIFTFIFRRLAGSAAGDNGYHAYFALALVAGASSPTGVRHGQRRRCTGNTDLVTKVYFRAS
ncbi:MAG: hypothetical protein IPP94_13640 [Ignavibacteria bacterium]|nr:hypothetical protein [Ignavibacteria bacterium]